MLKPVGPEPKLAWFSRTPLYIRNLAKLSFNKLHHPDPPPYYSCGDWRARTKIILGHAAACLHKLMLCQFQNGLPLAAVCLRHTPDAPPPAIPYIVFIPAKKNQTSPRTKLGYMKATGK